MSHLTNLQSRMKAGEVEAVLVSSEINQRYLTGLNYTDGYVLVLPEAAYLLADFRYIEVARATAGSAGIEVVMPEGGMLPCVAGLLEKHAVRHLAYEEETVSCALRWYSPTPSALPCRWCWESGCALPCRSSETAPHLRWAWESPSGQSELPAYRSITFSTGSCWKKGSGNMRPTSSGSPVK